MDVLEIAIKISRELGIPALLVIAFIIACYKIGASCREAVVWAGPNFLLPIRDAFIENIAMLTRFVTQANEILPKIHLGQERLGEKFENIEDTQNEIARNADDVKKMQKALSLVISHQCDASDCWFKKNRRTFDSDKIAE